MTLTLGRRDDRSAPHLGPRLVLGSASPRRLALLAQIGVKPDAVLPAEIDETPRPREGSRALAERLALEKALASAAIAGERADLVPWLTLAADTVVGVGRRVLPKCETPAEAEACLALLSGRGHRVFTGLALVTGSGAVRRRLVETRLKFKRLSRNEIEAYLASGEWRGKAGAMRSKASPARLSSGWSAPTPMSSACRSPKRLRCSPAKAIMSTGAGTRASFNDRRRP